MTISGFSFVRNATRLYYPVKQSILSILDIVDEFVVAVGAGDAGDKTRAEIERIKSPKIKILDTEWDIRKYPNGAELAHQTDLAKDACRGDWLFYLQSDEAVHERYHQHILRNCKDYLDDHRVEGFLFNYKHFWGDYWHYNLSHAWYPKEIRIIRNKPDIHSWRDAQSFRKIPHFNGVNYHQKEGTNKLDVIQLEAEVYHYGWVRPPDLMTKKNAAFAGVNSDGHEPTPTEEAFFDYGALGNLNVFNESHPAAMQDWIEKFNWQDRLNYSTKGNPGLAHHPHEKMKYRILTFIEQKFLGGNLIGGFKNYHRIK